MGIVLILLIVFVLVVISFEFASYTLLIPDPSQKSFKVRKIDAYLGKALYTIAYLLSLLRAPLGLVPYLTKMFIFFVLSISYESPRSTYFRECINLLGDIVNLVLTTLLVWIIIGPPGIYTPAWILYLPIGAEIIRLLAERIPVVFSALWQLLPHRRIALAIQSRQQTRLFWQLVARYLHRYCRYYALTHFERMHDLLLLLKARAINDADLSNRLAYIQAFRIIPQHFGLRGGRVRDVAKGEVYIHESWTSDPWLLIGMAIRRAPWMFDPRYLRRPFYYMTEANRAATLFVLEHARYSPLFAVFQFGHEIRVA